MTRNRTVYICGDFKFPKGDAVANRMHYIAKAASNVLIPACFQNTRAVSRYMMEALMLRGVPVKGALRAVIGRKTEL